jgi:hypothetical protein
MSNSVLGTYTFSKQPTGMTLIQKDREVAHQKTYSNVALFSWGASYIGKPIELSWSIMTSSQYASLQTIYEADTQVVFDPQDGTAKTFNVEILSLDGEYFIHLSNAAGHYRKNVKMQLLIMSEVA